jgi:hypothetical protein
VFTRIGWILLWAILVAVFDGTWELLKLTYPNRDPSKDEEARTELA